MGLQIGTDGFDGNSDDTIDQEKPGFQAVLARCDLIHAMLNILLLRAHMHVKAKRLGVSGAVQASVQSGIKAPLAPPILQPIIDLLQYEVFLERLMTEIHNVSNAMRNAGMQFVVRFIAGGESGEQLIKLIEHDSPLKIGGETVLRIDNRQVFYRLFLAGIA
jgi:mediator of RNA polymerase II transcription subunit 17, fungi type